MSFMGPRPILEKELEEYSEEEQETSASVNQG